LPLARYDNTKSINVGTAHQFTYVPQIGYSEGLGKFWPGMKGWWFDLVANASIHTDGKDPIFTALAPGVAATFNTLTQSTSYDVKAFLRYTPGPHQFFALGIEKSWGGEQIATNGAITVAGVPVAPLLPVSLSKDDYLRGHLQFGFPLAQDFAVAADLHHDFARVGGFKDDFGAEIRVTKFFFPTGPAH